MADEKKKENARLTDDQLNKAAGGVGEGGYTCEGCKKFYSGDVFKRFNGKPYCVNCYAAVANPPEIDRR